MTRLYTLIASAGLCMTASATSPLTVTLTNDLPFDRSEMAELDNANILRQLGSPYARVSDADGNTVASQTTHDGLLIFPATVGANAAATYTISACDSPATCDTIAWGRAYPERADDIAWENEYAGFRIYGPATQRRGERAFGYDIFFKYPTAELIVPQLYAAQCSGENWHKVDSLRHIDPRLAKDFENSFTYHRDHGQGMDCYAVGATLGDGVAVPVVNDSLRFAWCYDTAEVLDNGPLRFTVQLDFAPRAIGNSPAVAEHRVISLDAGSNLNRASIWYDGLTETLPLAAGFPLRDDSPVMASPRLGTLAYADPTQGPDNGKALLGLVVPVGDDADLDCRQGHALITVPDASATPFTYLWGFSWDRGNYADLASWADYLGRRALAQLHPLGISFGN